MKSPKSILMAVILGDLGDSKLMMMREKRFFQLPDSRVTLESPCPPGPVGFPWTSGPVPAKLKWAARLFVLTTFPRASSLASRLTAPSPAPACKGNVAPPGLPRPFGALGPTAQASARERLPELRALPGAGLTPTAVSCASEQRPRAGSLSDRVQ